MVIGARSVRGRQRSAVHVAGGGWISAGGEGEQGFLKEPIFLNNNDTKP